MLLADGWMVPQPKQNVWVTLANITNQETLGLSVASPDNPFSTCLSGLPMHVWPVTEDTIHTMWSNSPNNEWIHNWVDIWDYWTLDVPHVPLEPQELEVFGSVTRDYYMKFEFKERSQSIMWDGTKIQYINNREFSWWGHSLAGYPITHQRWTM